MSSMSPFAKFNTAPKAHGLYDPTRDRDACGLAMVATLRGTAGHDIIETALNALRNLEHRGAIGSDAGTGDGAGILSQIPDGFFRSVVDFKLPAKGAYGTGLVFLTPMTPFASSLPSQTSHMKKVSALSVGAMFRFDQKT